MKWTQGIVRDKTVWSDGLFTLHIECPDVEPFAPGQFLQLGIEQPDGHLHRPYSVASPHSKVLDFYIVLVEDGKLTPHLWAMGVDSKIDVSARAAGSFTLDHCPEANTLWLIATGTGLAPYIAMLRTPEPWQRYSRIVVVHGVRYQRDLSYVEELEGWQKQAPEQFRYLPVVSREDGHDALRGRITHCLESGELESAAAAKIDEQSCLMMCGNPDMLDDLQAQLGDRGLKKHRRKEPGQIVVERYW